MNRAPLSFERPSQDSQLLAPSGPAPTHLPGLASVLVACLLGCSSTPGFVDPDDAGTSAAEDAGNEAHGPDSNDPVGDPDAGLAHPTDGGSTHSGVRPTAENTGPRYPLTDITPAQFLASRTCDRQRIVGNVQLDQSWMRGQTFTFTDCEIAGNLLVYLQGGGQQLPVDDMPVLKLDYTRVTGGISLLNAVKLTIDHSWMRGGQWSLKDEWSPFVPGPAPVTVSNSVFYQPQGTPPDHTEALHVAGFGSGYRFTNVAFIQQGPNNHTATATINFHGSDTVFDGCWFLWDGPTAAYYVVYINGPRNLVKDSWFASGAAYVYPDSDTLATYSGNRNVDTGELLQLP